MSEEKNYEEVVTEEVVEDTAEEVVAEDVITEGVITEEQNACEEPVQEPVKAKKGFATAALVFGIFAFITTLFLLNYVFGVLSLIFGISYLVKKADVKPKGKAITGIVLASLSLIISTTIWVGGYIYFTQTSITDIIDDAVGLLNNDFVGSKLEELTGGAVNGEMLEQLGSGEDIVNNMVLSMTGGIADLETLEAFVGEEISIGRVVEFVGDVKEEEITGLMNQFSAMDQEKMSEVMVEIIQDFKIDIESGAEIEITYEMLEEKFGKDFSLREIMDYFGKYVSTP